MVYCKRCELAYIRNGGKIENIKEAKVWIPFEDNVIWYVCEHCADEIAWANRALSLEDPKKKIARRRKQYLEEGKI